MKQVGRHVYVTFCNDLWSVTIDLGEYFAPLDGGAWKEKKDAIVAARAAATEYNCGWTIDD